jgi:hypothetical protein
MHLRNAVRWIIILCLIAGEYLSYSRPESCATRTLTDSKGGTPPTGGL